MYVCRKSRKQLELNLTEPSAGKRFSPVPDRQIYDVLVGDCDRE